MYWKDYSVWYDHILSKSAGIRAGQAFRLKEKLIKGPNLPYTGEIIHRNRKVSLGHTVDSYLGSHLGTHVRLFRRWVTKAQELKVFFFFKLKNGFGDTDSDGLIQVRNEKIESET